jgi:hypothetical protein
MKKKRFKKIIKKLTNIGIVSYRENTVKLKTPSTIPQGCFLAFDDSGFAYIAKSLNPH